MLDDNSIGLSTRPDLNLSIYDETKFSSCHTPYTNNILHPVSSYYFLSNKKLFQIGNFNVNERPDLLYFSIWGVYLKTYHNQTLWPVKTAKTLCIPVWWNVIHSTKSSVVLLALKAKGQKYWMSLVCIYDCVAFLTQFGEFVCPSYCPRICFGCRHVAFFIHRVAIATASAVFYILSSPSVLTYGWN